MKLGTYADLKLALNGEETFKKDDCPFCRDIALNDRILWRGSKWAILWNAYPYTLNEKHIMLIPVRHVHFSYELTSEEMAEIVEAYEYIRDFYADGKYFSFTRESLIGRSVEHLHTHFIVGHLERKAISEMLRIQGIPINDD